MAPEDDFSDDFVANLLKKDAAAMRRASALGLSADSGRSRSSAPKPNTRFLQNILRDTSSHNAALLAKEQAEARQRQEKMARTSKGQTSPPEPQSPRSRRGREEGTANKMRDRDEHPKQKKKKKHRHRSRTPPKKRRRSRSASDESDDELEKEEGPANKIRDKVDRPKEKKKHRHRSRSPPAKRRRSRSASDESDDDREKRKKRKHRHRHRDRSRSRERQKRKDRRTSRSRSPKRKHRDGKDRDAPARATGKDGVDEDLDPLEAIVGPVERGEATVRMRGRGAFSLGSKAAMDEHFNGEYDPSADKQPDGSDESDWEQALQAMRDRQQWRAAGAERLRAAGFDDDTVDRWKTGASRQAGEDDVDNVRWSARGSRREWDAGKVQILNAEEEGRLDVELRASFLSNHQMK